MSWRQFTKEEAQEVISKDLFELLGIELLDEEKKKTMLTKIGDIIESRFWNRLFLELKTRNLVDEFKKVEEDEEGAKKLFQDNNIDLEAILREEVVLFKTQLKTSTNFIESEANENSSTEG